jgi:hypothetical protein
MVGKRKTILLHPTAEYVQRRSKFLPSYHNCKDAMAPGFRRTRFFAGLEGSDSTLPAS